MLLRSCWISKGQYCHGIPGQALAQLEACNPFAELNTPPVATVFGGNTPVEVNLITNDEGKVIAVDLEGFISKIERLLVFHLFPYW